jgi:phosphoglycolate phosphatase-like HAD superfamily hydrolase
LFDIDGTLIRSGGAGVRAFERTADTEFDRPGGTRQLQFAGRTDYSLVREFFLTNDIEPVREHFDRFFNRYVFLLDHLLPLAHGGVIDGVGDFLRRLCALPEPPVLGLLTGNIQLGAEIKLRHFGLWDRFVMGAFSDDHEDRNRLAAIGLERGRRILDQPLEGSEVMVIGDTPHDIRCGRAIGAKVLAVSTGGSTHAELRKCGPDFLANSLGEVDAAAVCS